MSIINILFTDVISSPWRNEQIEKEVDFVQKAAKVIRSARSDYNIPNKTKTDVYIVCNDITTNDILKKFAADLATTAFCGNIEFNIAAPVGCAILTVSGQCEVHLMLKGLIDAEKELVKLQKKKDQLVTTVTKLNQAMTTIDYASKVPADVQESNIEKLSQSESEIERIEAAMETLKLM